MNETIEHDEPIQSELNLHEIKRAYDAGCNWAINLKVGDQFIGAAPAAAEYAGINGKDSLQYRLFLCGALNQLDAIKRLCTTKHPVITEISWR